MCPVRSDGRKGYSIRVLSRRRCALVAIVLGLRVAQVLAQCPGDELLAEQKLTATDPEGNDTFGISVSVSGDTALVGARSEDCAVGRVAPRGNSAPYLATFLSCNRIMQECLTTARSRVCFKMEYDVCR